MQDLAKQIQRALDGQDEAFGDIVRCYQRRLFHFLGRMGLSQSQSEDVAQDTFIRALRHLHRYDQSRATFTTWLFTIARNLAVSELRRRGNEPDQRPVEALVDPGASPEQCVEFSQLKTQLQTCLRALSQADRTVLALAYDSELGSREAAAIAQCSEAAYRTRLHRARAKLRNCLEQSNVIQ